MTGEETSDDMTNDDQGGANASAIPPMSALVLGYAGLLPPLAGIVARSLELATGHPPTRASALLLVGGLIYGGLILSFLGGTWWGAACARRQGPALRRWLVVSVMPSLVALLCLVAGIANARGGALLALALATTPLVDRTLAIEGLVPRWWMALRLPLSFGLALEMLALAMLA